MSNLVFFSTKPFCRELYWICVSRMWRSPMYIPTSGSHSMRVASPERSHTRPKAGDDAACAKDYSCLIIQSTQTITSSSLSFKLYKSKIILFFCRNINLIFCRTMYCMMFFWANERSNFHLPFGPTKKGVPFDCIDYSIFIKASDMMSQFLKHHSPLKSINLCLTWIFETFANTQWHKKYGICLTFVQSGALHDEFAGAPWELLQFSLEINFRHL